MATADGITRVDPRDGSAVPLAHPRNITLVDIDGLYTRGHSLIAVQNGVVLLRIVAFTLSAAWIR